MRIYNFNYNCYFYRKNINLYGISLMESVLFRSPEVQIQINTVDITRINILTLPFSVYCLRALVPFRASFKKLSIQLFILVTIIPSPIGNPSN